MNKSKYIEIPRKLYRKIETESRILEDGSFNSSFNVNEKILVILNINACVASGGWVPMGQGAATAIHLKAEEHPQAYQPATQPRAPRAQPPTIAPVTLRPEAQCDGCYSGGLGAGRLVAGLRVGRPVGVLPP